MAPGTKAPLNPPHHHLLAILGPHPETPLEARSLQRPLARLPMRQRRYDAAQSSALRPGTPPSPLCKAQLPGPSAL